MTKAVCYTTDAGYLLPSFVSALQARHHLSPGTAEVVIIAFDADDLAKDAFGAACKQAGISFLPASTAAVEGASPYYRRFFLADLLPTEIDAFLYVDGDTQITRPLDPLLSYPLPRDRFLAVTDPMSFSLPGNDKLSLEFAAHFQSLGLSPEQTATYFNSGVLMSGRELWREIGREAWALSRRQLHDTRFPDQDVLNLVAHGRNLPLSLAWNFPIYMKNLPIADIVQPGIVHYMSSPKPWFGAFPPWTRAEYNAYGDALLAYPALTPYSKSMKPLQRLRYHLQQRYKRLRSSERSSAGKQRARILAYERGAILHSEAVHSAQRAVDLAPFPTKA